MQNFTYKDNTFYKNGQPHRVFAGAIHYFRVLPGAWKDRLLKLKNAGFNAVETYLCWSLHERTEGNFNFSGRLDFARFVDEAKALDLDVIIRPGPFICAETDFGGLPSWLLTYEGIELRCDNEIFLSKVDAYFAAIAPIIKPRLINNGGNVLMMQVENEYGSYGNDKIYKRKLVELYKKHGFDCLLFTADGTQSDMLKNGRIEGVLQAFTYGSKPKENIEQTASVGKQPHFCAEYWNGWYDFFGEDHHCRSAENISQETQEFLENNASFSFYMFHGGTNFDMINGSVFVESGYRFETTSYDYDAPLNEAGDMTEKYYSLKEVMETYTGKKFAIPVENSRKIAYEKLTATEIAPLLENLDCFPCTQSALPMTLEQLGVDFGYALYTTNAFVGGEGEIWLRELRDRATVFLDEDEIIFGGNTQDESREIPEKLYGKQIEVRALVENRGRCNYGFQLKDPKGILKGVILRNKLLMQFKNYAIRAELPKALVYRQVSTWTDLADKERVGFYKFEMQIKEVADTFLYPKGFKNGCVYVNGQNIGRYCNLQPPQRTLYVPAELLKEGKNEIVIFETDGSDNPIISFSEKHIYAEIENERYR